MRYTIIYLLLLVPFFAAAQLQDDFSDGDLSNNPTWLGDAANFKVNTAGALQLDAPGAGASALYAPVEVTDSAIWELYFRLDFDPSNGNRLRVYLQSDSENLLMGSGYYLLVGEDGAADRLKFYRQDAGVATLLAEAAAGTAAASPEVRLRMTRTEGSNWTLSADYSGGQNLVQEFTTVDATYGSGSAFFGFHCLYTATRTDKFFFDDVNVAQLVPDTQAPVLLSATAISPTEVEVVFNEPLDETSAGASANFSINNGIGQPMDAFLDAANKTLVHLILNNPLVSGQTYVLTINNLQDVVGNETAAQTADFDWFLSATAVEFDILINEILADTTPQVGLPKAEYIELFNRSDKVFDLAGFGFSSGGAPQVFASRLLLPGEYLIVCDDSNASLLAPFGNVATLPNFPALSNDADDLTLISPSGNTIHGVSYNLGWYRDAIKDDGGWSLELINPLAPCGGGSNWIASKNLLGGTPGQPNSVLDETPDMTGPSLLRVFASAANPSEVLLFFDKSLDKTSAGTAANFSIANATVASAILLGPANNSVKLLLGAPLLTSVIYEIIVSPSLADCTGNGIGPNDRLTFGLPEPIEPQDIVLNEILFNPASGGSDFVEIYNRSNKIFNLSDLIIGNLSATDTLISKVENDYLLYPGGYAVFSENPADLRSRYLVQNDNALINNDLPSFNDDAGNVTLYRADSTGAVIIDAFDYSEDFHHPLLDDVDGISLERLSFDETTQNASNWHSAAAAVGFATPTYQNSQFFENQTVADDFFDIPEPTFSPDGDGYIDFLLLNYQADKPGYVANIKVFDAEGRPVKSLASNELLSTEGFLRWDGDTDRGEKARIGIYVVWIELFHPDGDGREFKKTCVVAGRL